MGNEYGVFRVKMDGRLIKVLFDIYLKIERLTLVFLMESYRFVFSF